MARRFPKVIILGADGMDPEFVEPWLAEGKLPNLAKIKAQGFYSRLGTTNPAESPVAWSSFISGKNPGKHGIFDFLSRDSATYLPHLAAMTVVQKRFGKPLIISNREGGAFWDHLGKAGLSTTALQVPVTFPPPSIRGELMSGLGVPDVRGSWGTSYLFTSMPIAECDYTTEFGGCNTHVEWKDGAFSSYLIGPRHMKLPFRVKRLSDSEIEIELDGQKHRVRAGEWSEWFTPRFRIAAPFFVVHGLCRFHLNALEPNLALYCSAVSFHPNHPFFPITQPPNLASRLYKKLGIYKTLGWATDTWGLNEGRIDDEPFMEDVRFTEGKREEICLNRLENSGADFFVMVFQATDRIMHMFRHAVDPLHPLHDESTAAYGRDRILEIYQRFDTFLGKVMERMEPDTTLIILSDHGFRSYRTAVNLNTWLVEHGYLKLGKSSEGQMKLTDLFDQGTFWPNVDWTHSKAYALGLGKIYINLRGREALGVVEQGREYENLRDEIIEKLMELTDVDGNPVMRKMFKKDHVYSGEFVDDAGDLVVGFNDGYRVSWQTALGGIPSTILETNKRKWSGDHCSYDPDITKGVLFVNKPWMLAREPEITDLGPTVLALYGIAAPRDMDGKSFYVK